VLPKFSLGDEVWCLLYDRDLENWAPNFAGNVEAIGYRGVYAGGKWYDGYPLFKTRAECESWIAANPHQPPTIK
jgi:hypothetical protein